MKTRIYATPAVKGLKSFEIKIGKGFLLSRYCYDFAESDVKLYSLIQGDERGWGPSALFKVLRGGWGVSAMFKMMGGGCAFKFRRGEGLTEQQCMDIPHCVPATMRPLHGHGQKCISFNSFDASYGYILPVFMHFRTCTFEDLLYEHWELKIVREF